MSQDKALPSGWGLAIPQRVSHYWTFQNTRILKLKLSQLQLTAFAFFAPLKIILADILGHRSLLQRVHGLWLEIGGFRSVLCVSVTLVWGFIACDCNYDWWQRRTSVFLHCFCQFIRHVPSPNIQSINLDNLLGKWWALKPRERQGNKRGW